MLAAFSMLIAAAAGAYLVGESAHVNAQHQKWLNRPYSERQDELARHFYDRKSDIYRDLVLPWMDEDEKRREDYYDKHCDDPVMVGYEIEFGTREQRFIRDIMEKEGLEPVKGQWPF